MLKQEKVFPKEPNKYCVNTAWVRGDMKAWHKFKVEVKRKQAGKLTEHFTSLSHKSVLIDINSFLSSNNHIHIF